MNRQFDIDVAKQKDKTDPLKIRSNFTVPQHNGKEAIYFTGHSLGLQHKDHRVYLDAALSDWGKLGVEGHFKASTPWFDYHKTLRHYSSTLVGAKENEVVTMNGLSVNLHLLLTSFYQPSKKKYKILCEPNLFPSDLYILKSQIQLRGFNPETSIVFLPADEDGVVLADDICSTIERYKDELALVFIGAVNYYTGQVFNVEEITKIAHLNNILIGFDLAHAAGNVELNLHDWNVDFAAWCSYKYLNSGPGNVSTIFIHENQIQSNPFRLCGWWGHESKNRFSLNNNFQAIKTAEGWQLSNAPVFGMSIYRQSLELFHEVGLDNLIQKRIKLNNYLEDAINTFNHSSNKIQLKIITPGAAEMRGAQLSIYIASNGKEIYNKLRNYGVYADWRSPSIMRISTVPLYNSFEDIARFYHILQKCI